MTDRRESLFEVATEFAGFTFEGDKLRACFNAWIDVPAGEERGAKLALILDGDGQVVDAEGEHALAEWIGDELFRDFIAECEATAEAEFVRAMSAAAVLRFIDGGGGE